MARREIAVLLSCTFIVAACGLIYEVLIGTAASYLSGQSAYQFSLTVGLFLGAMGIGSFLSRSVHYRLLEAFLLVELGQAIVGGFSVCLMFGFFALSDWYQIGIIAIILIIGVCIGYELPLLTRYLRRYGPLRTVIANVLSLDYLGGVLGALSFPLILLPTLGLMRTAFLVGLINAFVALWVFLTFRWQLEGRRFFAFAISATAVLLTFGLANSLRWQSWLESSLYDDEIIYAEQTSFQRIVLTKWRNDLRLFLDGELQFSSVDEHRYHESLAHPAMALAKRKERVLVLGGGDGLLVREVVKYPQVRTIVLVDIDPKMTKLAKQHPALVQLNERALQDKRIQIVNVDAYRFLMNNRRPFDVVLIDLPDPNTESLARLYTLEFYRLVARNLKPEGIIATQATSPFETRAAFWCIVKTIEASGFKVLPYWTAIPTFGIWGFAIAAKDWLPDLNKFCLTVPTKYLTEPMIKAMTIFPPDCSPVDVAVNRLDNLLLLRYYLRPMIPTGLSKALDF
ncbi:MAG: polyamine aminopropyltransferase [Armatimonadetes bacterium]|nr:polyamine aminopropyltransferase [Armatimonadota bacterium]